MKSLNYTELIIQSLKKQGFDLDISEIPINIFLKNTGDILIFCFIENEDDDCLVVAETIEDGSEELRILPKENIEYVGVYYEDQCTTQNIKSGDNMYS